MNIKANLTMGKSTYQFEINEPKDMEALHKAIVLTNPRNVCEVCKTTEGFYFTTNKDKEGNIYVNVKCKCGATSKLGQYKTGGYFWHEFEQYVPKKTE
jgi:hypothetical protein